MSDKIEFRKSGLLEPSELKPEFKGPILGMSVEVSSLETERTGARTHTEGRDVDYLALLGQFIVFESLVSADEEMIHEVSN